MARQQRRLEDLWANGEMVPLDDGKGRVEVWMQPVNEPEEEIAHNRASAARARVLVLRRDPDSELVMQVTDEVMQLSDEYLVEYLALHDLHRFQAEVEAEEAAEEEWAKDDYLSGLQDAWEPPRDLDGSRPKGLLDEWAVDKEHSEAKRVFAELNRYLEQCEARLGPVRERVYAEKQGLPRAELERAAIDKLVDSRAQMAWAEEFRRCLMWLGTRHPDNHLEYYYARRDVIDRLPTPVFNALREAALRVNVDVLAGKGLRLLRASLKPSVSPAAPETAPSSGPVAVAG